MDKKLLIIIIAIIAIILLIPVILVTGLVVVGLGLQTINQGNSVPEASAKSAWKAADPFAIVDWAQKGTTLTVILKNNTADTITFNKMNLTSDIENSDKSEISASSTKTITFTVPNCSAGLKYAYAKSGISINYSTAAINNKTMNAPADLVGSC